MRCVSISHEAKVSQWPDGKELYYYKPRCADNSPIKTVSLGKNGTWMLLSQRFSFVEIVSLGDQAKHLNSIQSVKNATCATFSHLSTRRVAIGTSSGQLVIYDLKSKCIKQQCPMKPMQYFQVQYTLNDTHVLGACEDGKVYVYKTVSSNEIAALSIPHSKKVTSFRCHPVKQNFVGLGSEKGVVAMWDYNFEKPVANYEAHKLCVADILMKSDTILSIGGDRRLSIFDYRAKNIVQEKLFSHSPTAFDLHSDDVSLAVGFTDGLVYGFDLRSMNQTTQVLAKHTTRINQIAFDADSGKPSVSLISTDIAADSPVSSKSECTESFSTLYCEGSEFQSDSINVNPNNNTDSFLAGLSLKSHNGNIDNTNSRIHFDVSRRRSNVNNTTTKCSLRLDEASEMKETGAVGPVFTFEESPANEVQRPIKKTTTATLAASTPTTANMPSPIYPITMKPNNENIRLMVKEVVQEQMEAVQEEMEKFKKEMKSQFFDLSLAVRMNHLSLQWMLNKMDIETKQSLEQLRNDLLQPEEPF